MSDWPLLLGFARAHRGEPMALVTLVEREGSSYRLPGARLLAVSDGDFCGSLSGGCLEEGIAVVAREVISTGVSRIERIDTRPHFGCPGRLKFLIEKLPDSGLLEDIERRLAGREPFFISTGYETEESGTRITAKASHGDGCLVESVEPAPRLIAVGASSDLDPVFRIARVVGWDCHRVVRDPRQADGLEVVDGESVHCVAPEDLAARFVPDAASAVVVMSHHLTNDLAYLKCALAQGYGYVGLLGSRRRREILLGGLGELGMLENPEWLDSFHAPVGIDIGASHPSTIALSIVAEIQAALTKSGAGFLRDRLGTIHPGVCNPV